MQTVLVTIDFFNQSVDLKMPAETPLQELFPYLLRACDIAVDPAYNNLASWVISRVDTGERLLPVDTLDKARIYDGVRLRLQDQVSWQRQEDEREKARKLNQPGDYIAPSDATGGIGILFRRGDLVSERLRVRES